MFWRQMEETKAQRSREGHVCIDIDVIGTRNEEGDTFIDVATGSEVARTNIIQKSDK